MQNDYEALLNMFLSSKGISGTKSMDKIKSMFQSGEGLENIKKLANNNPDILRQLMGIVMSNDKESAKAMISKLTSTKEGAEVASAILRMLGE